MSEEQFQDMKARKASDDFNKPVPSPLPEMGEVILPQSGICRWCNRGIGKDGYGLYRDNSKMFSETCNLAPAQLGRQLHEILIPKVSPLPEIGSEPIAKHEEDILQRAKAIVLAIYRDAEPVLFHDGRWTMQVGPEKLTQLGWSATERELWIDMAIWLTEPKPQSTPVPLEEAAGEVRLPELDVTQEDRETAKASGFDAFDNYNISPARACRERQLLAALRELRRVKDENYQSGILWDKYQATTGSHDFTFSGWLNWNVNRCAELLAELRRREGETWIEIKEGCEMPCDGEEVTVFPGWFGKPYPHTYSTYFNRFSHYQVSAGHEGAPVTHWQRIAPPTPVQEEK